MRPKDAYRLMLGEDSVASETGATRTFRPSRPSSRLRKKCWSSTAASSCGMARFQEHSLRGRVLWRIYTYIWKACSNDVRECLREMRVDLLGFGVARSNIMRNPWRHAKNAVVRTRSHGRKEKEMHLFVNGPGARARIATLENAREPPLEWAWRGTATGAKAEEDDISGAPCHCFFCPKVAKAESN